MRTALIDADCLLYEVAFGSQRKDPDTGEVEANAWEFVEDLFHRKLEVILDESQSDDYLLYITNGEWLNGMLNRRDRLWSDPVPYVPNFRIAAAQKYGERDYKGNRVQDKPLHYYNLLAYFANLPQSRISREGLEADDMMAMEQTSRLDKMDTIICSRDKDLRQVPGWTYTWEVGKQAGFGPHLVTDLGYLNKEVKRDKNGKIKENKVTGTGAKFLYYQMIAGDGVDNIQGLKGKGPVFGYDLLWDKNTERECYEAVSGVYRDLFPDTWKERITATATLVYLIRERQDDGSFKGWRPPAKDG